MEGRLPEWLKGADCKSVGIAFAGSNPAPPIALNDGWRVVRRLGGQWYEVIEFGAAGVAQW